MEKIAKGLSEMKAQGRLRGYIAAVNDADVLSGLLEDIRDAMLEYQASDSTS